MKRGFCLFLLSLIIVGLFVTPADYEITDEMIDHFGETLPDEVHYPDLEFPTLNYFPSAEGTVHEDSILEFYETTDEDVLFYPDLFTLDVTETPDNGYADGSEAGTWTNTQTKDATTWDISAGDAYLEVLARADVEGFAYSLYAKEHAVGNAIEFAVYDWDDSAYDTLVTIAGTSLGWHNGTANTAGYVNSTNYLKFRFDIAVTEAVYIDYLEMDEWHVLTMMDSDHYAESFTDVSDWSISLNEAGESLTTDSDVATLAAEGDSSADRDNFYTNSPSLSSWQYIEIRYKMNSTAGYSWTVYVLDADSHLTDEGRNSYKMYETTDWYTGRWHIDDYDGTLDDYDGKAETIIIQARNNDGIDTECYVDYLRMGSTTESGWQHDCSTTEGFDYQATKPAIVFSSDGDSITCDPSGDDARIEIQIDTTATQAKITEDYYQFIEFSINSITDGDADGAVWKFRAFESSTVYSVFLDADWSDDSGVFRYNLDALTIDGGGDLDEVEYFKFYLDDADDVLVLDYIGLYSIANFTLSDLEDETISIVAYVDSGTLVVSDATDYIRFEHDPTLSVTVATHNVWNATVSSGASGFRFLERSDTWTYHDVGETRGALTSTTLTDFDILTYGAVEVSAIKFWEDATAPTIEEKWSTPQDPDTSDDVTISIVTTDVVGVYEATATPLSEPEGSSVGTQTFTLIDTNPSGAMFWITTIDDSKLIEGHYIFEIDANDGANSDYEYLTFTVIQESKTTYIRIFDSLGDFVPFETFEVYRNGTRQYTDTFEGDTESAYQIQVKDRWGESLNTTTFSAGDQELVVTVEVYSLKVMSWHYDFVRFNVTRAGLTYSEIVTPLEVINFRLYTNTYDWAIDYLNGTSTSGNINLTNSTALVVTGSTISDVYGLVNTVNTMTTAINITTTTISNEVVTVQLMFDWSNTTLYNQTINIIAAFNWENTTIYNQTVSIASLFNATNTVLYDQIILIQNMFNWENTTLYNQTISILNAFNATNTVLYSQTVSILADISNVNSTIYAQTVQMLLDLENSNSTLYDQTVTLLANIANVDSDIAAQTVTILADIDNVNSTIYAQTVQMLTDINNINSTIYAQTVMILSNLSDLNATVYLVDDPTHLNPLVLGHSLSDDYCDLTIVTNWHNASISVYDNDVLRTGPTSELLCPIRYPLMSTSGTHNLSVYVDAGNDSFWYNISYTVAEIIAFELEDWDVTPHLGVENYMECFFRTTWENSTIYVYLNDSLQTSVLEQEGGISFSFWMTGTPGLHQYVFNVTSGANVITITWDFYLPDWAETALVMRWDLWTFQDNYTMLELESNWMNCTYYVYLNSSLVATSANDPVIFNFTRAINIGTYNLTLYADGGAQTYTIKNIRYIITEEGVSYDYSQVTGGRSVRYGDNYYYYTETTESQPGILIDQGTAAIVSVGGFLIVFVAYLAARELRKKEILKTERLFGS